METKQKGKLFYGWIVVALLFLMAAGPMVWLSNFFGYFQYPVCEELGCSYVQFNLCSTASTVVGVLFGVFLSAKVAMGKTRFWVLGGGILAGVCLYLMGNANNIYVMIALFGLANIGFNAYAYIPLNVLIANWFVDKKGLATSIVMAGMGVGGMIFTPIVSNLIAESWRNAYHVSAYIVLGVPLVVSWFLKKPADMGLTPLMPKAAPAAEGAAPAAPAWEGITKKEALKTPAFYFYALMCICCGIVAAGVAIQLPTFFIENGIDYSSRMTIYSAASLVGLLCMGTVIDKLGIKVGGGLTGGLLIASMIALVLVPVSPVFSFVAVVLNPLGGCITSLGPPLLAGQVFGTKEYGAIYGLGNSMFMLGCMIGPVGAAAIRTLSGSYIAAWIAFAAVAALLIVSVFMAAAGGNKLRNKS